MARFVDGVQTILRGARLICRMVNRFGVTALAARTSPDFANAVQALVIACQVLETVDNVVAAVDRTVGGSGVNDEDLPVGVAQTLANEQADKSSGGPS